MLSILLASAALWCLGAGGAAAPVRITVLVDNTVAVEGGEADRGFACLVDAPGGRVLFDTGTRQESVRRNAARLGVGLSGIRAVVLSNMHGDHTGGLPRLLSEFQEARVYVPAGCPYVPEQLVTAAAGRLIRVTIPVEIVPGVWTTGEVDGPLCEQALVVATTRGPVVITGCAHPGVVTLARCAAAVAEGVPTMVVGGFHLLEASPDQVDGVIAGLKALGVRRVAPGHCTGKAAIVRFLEAFGEGSAPLGVGAVVRLEG